MSFNNGSRQNEKFNQELIERFDAEPLFYNENHFEVAVVSNVVFPENYGELFARQLKPCQEADGDCKFEDRFEEVPIVECSAEKLAEISEYWIKTKGVINGQLFADSSQCLDLENLYIAGEPNTNSEASLIVSYWIKDALRNDEHADYNDAYFKKLDEMELMLHVSFNQVDMSTGGFNRVIRGIDMNRDSP